MTTIMPKETQDEVEGPEQFFTGRATIRGQFSRDEPSHVTGAIVTFEPGSTHRLAHPSSRADADRHRRCGVDPSAGRPSPQ